MKLSVREVDKLQLHTAGLVAQKRLARGVRLNAAESAALIATQVWPHSLSPPHARCHPTIAPSPDGSVSPMPAPCLPAVRRLAWRLRCLCREGGQQA